MRTKLFKFHITDFEEVYTVIDDENKRLHISSVNYSYSVTLDLTRDLKVEIEQQTKLGNQNFNNRVRKALFKIIEELKN
ncbi:hypothetical protein [Bacillus weihaiensis]|uniref:hypothetical protein n=1 Tax=Bacillus weihaiensis TaxID=1547283 RepID=UPI002352CBEC|nr:hypothetical protein [Bacillus weihaiensis]